MTEISDAERQIAIQQIQELQARRCLAVDTKDWATHETLHAPDFRSYKADGDKWVPGAKVYTEWVATFSANRLSMHHVFTPILTFESPARASGVTNMEDYVWWKQGDQDHWLHGFGFYDETFEKRDGQWVFTSRNLRRHKVLTSPGAELTQPATPVG